MGSRNESRSGEHPRGAADTASPKALIQSTEPPEIDTNQKGDIHFVEVNHADSTSVSDVVDSVAVEKADVVALELDEDRYRQLVGQDDEEVDRDEVLSGQTTFQFLGQWLQSVAENRFSGHFETTHEDALRTILESVETANGTVATVDRNLNVTTQRLWKQTRFGDRLRVGGALVSELGGSLKAALAIGLFWGLLLGATVRLFTPPLLIPPETGPDGGLPVLGEFTEPTLSFLDAIVVIILLGLAFATPLYLLLAAATRGFDTHRTDIEELLDTDPTTLMTQEFARSHEDAVALTDQRNTVIARRLLALRDTGYDTLAVVGAGRRDDIEHYVESPSSLPQEAQFTEPLPSGRLRSVLYRGFGYACMLGFGLLFVLLALGGAQDWLLIQLFVSWFLVNFIAAAGVAYLSGAHWKSASAGGAVAWVTSVNPLITPGLFVAYVELRYTKVRLSDVPVMKNVLQKGTGTLTNRVGLLYRDVGLFRLLCIMTAANLASFTASVLFVVALLPYIAADVGGIEGIGRLLVDGIEEGTRLIAGQ